MIHYKVLALNEDGSLKLEPVDLDVGSSFDASSSYRNYIFVKIFFLSQFCRNFLPNFCNKNIFFLQAAPIGNIFLLTILEELKISFAIKRMSSHKYSCLNFIYRWNFKAAENSSSSLAAEATEVSIRASDEPEREYLKCISQASKQAPENISQNQTTVYYQGPS